MNYFKALITCLFFVSSTLCAQTSPVLPGGFKQSGSSQSGISDVETKVYMDERKALQSRFSVAQSKLASKPEVSSAEAQLVMEEVNKEIEKLAQKTLSYELNRYSVWNSEGFWTVTLKSGKTTSYWSAGPSAKFAVQKLDDQIGKLKKLKVAIAGPFKKSDLNESQKTLDAIRAALDLDIELTRMAKQYLNNGFGGSGTRVIVY
jgi:hypothetical protein